MDFKKTHRSTVEGLKEALQLTFLENKHAEKVINQVLKAHKKWGSKDRRFVATEFYEIVRWYRKILFALEIPWTDNPLPKLTGNQLDTLIAFWLELREYECPEGFFNDHTDFEKNIQRFNTKNQEPEVAQALPDWLYKKIFSEFKENSLNLIKALNVPAKTYIRANTLKTNSKELFEKLQKESIPTKILEDPTLELKERRNVFITKAFKEGLFEVQDGGSQLIAPFCQVKPKMRVIDACAGAGGKSLHLATLMKNKGKLIALDIHDWKLKELRKRATRNNIDIIETFEANSKKIKRLKESADVLLLDVPCSGLGVLKRKADTKWKLSAEKIEELKETQKNILTNYSKMVKPGGHMVYATCSILPEENQNQVSHFLNQNEQWSLDEEVTLLPNKTPFDGFYMARLKRS